MKTTKEILEIISNYNYSQITFYEFNKDVLKGSDKYREGRLAALNYISELTLYYMNIEKNIQRELMEQIDLQMKSNSCLDDSKYKDGLYDALNDVIDEYQRVKV